MSSINLLANNRNEENCAAHIFINDTDTSFTSNDLELLSVVSLRRAYAYADVSD